MILTEQTKSVLEWPQFLDLFSGFITSEAAQHRTRKIEPVVELSGEIALTKEVLLCAQKGVLPTLSSLEDVESIIHKSAIENHIAEGIDLFRLAKLASLNTEIRSTGDGWKSEFPL